MAGWLDPQTQQELKDLLGELGLDTLFLHFQSYRDYPDPGAGVEYHPPALCLMHNF